MSAKKLRFPGSLQIATVAVLLLCATFAWGQATNTGTVIGIITDQSGAVVPGVTITLTDVNTKSPLTTTTNDSGRYVFVNVPPGNYDITASKTGFAVGKISSQSVRVGSQSNGNIQLTVGQQQQVVEVQASGTELQTLNATVGNTVTGVALESLPSLGRDVSTFATLQPGVTPEGNVAGTLVDNSSFQLDGGNNTNDMDGSMSVYTPSFAGDPTGGMGVGGQGSGVMPAPADSVEEFKVNTANQTADFNSSSGMQVQVVTKRGTNTFHGSLYEYYFDNNFNANTWDNNHSGTKNPSYHYSRFGASAGGQVLPNMLGGKTYLFGNYQGFRWPNSVTFERTVPTQAMRNGLLTFGGTTYNVKSATVDPRGVGVSPAVTQLFNLLPPPNDFSCSLSRCDNVNVAGFKGNLAVPQQDNFGVVRLDHDFGAKEHFFSSYRYYRLNRATTNQVDITGGNIKGDTVRPQIPWYLVYGLTSNITSSITNDVHFSYLRNYWSYISNGGAPQLAGLGAALEPFGESNANVLSPYNVDNQDVRTRFWDGQDSMVRDDITWLKGNHLMQFGGTYQHNFNWHRRTDNGGTINYYPSYQLGTTSGAGISIGTPAGFSGSSTSFKRDVAALLGVVSIAQQAFTRAGNNLQLNPPLTPAQDQSVIPYWNLYASDSWHMKPSITLTYGLGWTLELPPKEANNKLIEVVDANSNQIDLTTYMNARKAAALQGQVYNPILGFSLLSNTAGKPKYPYDPYYGEFSPRVAVAWSPHFDSGSMFGHVFGTDTTVIRGGYGRIYGRLNGVDLVLVPLLTPGFIQPVQCKGPQRGTGICGGTSTNLTNAFRIGVDGNTSPFVTPQQTLPQPDLPGVNDNPVAAGEGLDKHFRPNVTDTFTFSIQRQLGPKATLELGYIGRRITHEYLPINMNSVPTMMTLGGQTFAKAYAAIETYLGCTKSVTACGANVPSSTGAAYTAFLNSVPKQPFFEAAMKPGFCVGFSSCTAAVVDAESGGPNGTGNFESQSVWSLWNDLDAGAFNFPRSMLSTPLPGAFGANGQMTGGIGMNASIGYGNYNGAFFTIKSNDWHGLTTQQNFTWSKALGTGATVQASSEITANDPFNLSEMYGVQQWDRRFVYNVFVVYQPPFYKNQAGIVGRLLGGWNFAPVFTAGSGAPNTVYTVNGQSQAFGSGDSANFFDFENAIPTGPVPSSAVHYGVVGTNGVGTAGAKSGLNMWAHPDQVFALFRPPILGLDTRDGGTGPIRGLPYWNFDMSLRKNFKITERVSFEFQTIFTNLFNHVQFWDPNYAYAQQGNLDTSDSSSWGVLPGQENKPRQMQFGLRVNW